MKNKKIGAINYINSVKEIAKLKTNQNQFSSLKKFHGSEVSDKKQLLYHEALNGIL